MTDEHERDYHEAVAAWLDASFALVEHEVTLDSGLRPDFIARTPFESYVIEVENGTGNGELYNGLGQCLVYSQETGLTPVLVLPAEHGYDGPASYGPVQVVTV